MLLRIVAIVNPARAVVLRGAAPRRASGSMVVVRVLIQLFGARRTDRERSAYEMEPVGSWECTRGTYNRSGPLGPDHRNGAGALTPSAALLPVS